MSGVQLAVVLEQVAFSCRELDAHAHRTGRVLVYLLSTFIADSSGHSCASQGYATQATSSTEANFATSVVQAQVHAMGLRGQVQEPPPPKEWWQREACRFKYPDAPSGQQGRRFDFNALFIPPNMSTHIASYTAQRKDILNLIQMT